MTKRKGLRPQGVNGLSGRPSMKADGLVHIVYTALLMPHRHVNPSHAFGCARLTRMSISQAVMKQLQAVAYMIQESRQTLATGGPFSEGRSMNTLQDGVELLLRSGIEHRGIEIPERAPFNQLCKLLARELGPTPLTHATSLNQLNKVRVGFKHHA